MPKNTDSTTVNVLIIILGTVFTLLQSVSLFVLRGIKGSIDRGEAEDKAQWKSIGEVDKRISHIEGVCQERHK